MLIILSGNHISIVSDKQLKRINSLNYLIILKDKIPDLNINCLNSTNSFNSMISNAIKS